EGHAKAREREPQRKTWETGPAPHVDQPFLPRPAPDRERGERIEKVFARDVNWRSDRGEVRGRIAFDEQPRVRLALRERPRIQADADQLRFAREQREWRVGGRGRHGSYRMSVRAAAVSACRAGILVSLGLLALPFVVLAATSSVTIQNFAYSPTPLTIRAGDTVTWTNRDSAQHSAFFNDGFKTPALSQGQSASLLFSTAGTFSYICGIHGAAMKGTVVVQ